MHPPILTIILVLQYSVSTLFSEFFFQQNRKSYKETPIPCFFIQKFFYCIDMLSKIFELISNIALSKKIKDYLLDLLGIGRSLLISCLET